MRAYLYHPLAQMLTSALLLVSGLLLWLLFVQDEKGILRHSQIRMENEQLASQRMAQSAEESKAIILRHDQNLKEIQYFRDNFLSKRDQRVLEISRFLPEKAKEFSIQLEEIHYQSGSARDENLEIYQIELPLTGFYSDIRSFIDAIENSGLYLVVTQLGLEGESGGSVRMQLSLATFFEAKQGTPEVEP